MSHFIPVPNTTAMSPTIPSHPGGSPDGRLYYIGRNGHGQWVVRDESGLSGGIFVDRVQALKFAMFENRRHPEAVIMVPGVLELGLK
jgi:hypothetical protein